MKTKTFASVLFLFLLSPLASARVTHESYKIVSAADYYGSAKKSPAPLSLPLPAVKAHVTNETELLQLFASLPQAPQSARIYGY